MCGYGETDRVRLQHGRAMKSVQAVPLDLKPLQNDNPLRSPVHYSVILDTELAVKYITGCESLLFQLEVCLIDRFFYHS